MWKKAWDKGKQPSMKPPSTPSLLTNLTELTLPNIQHHNTNNTNTKYNNDKNNKMIMILEKIMPYNHDSKDKLIHIDNEKNHTKITKFMLYNVTIYVQKKCSENTHKYGEKTCLPLTRVIHTSCSCTPQNLVNKYIGNKQKIMII